MMIMMARRIESLYPHIVKEIADQLHQINHPKNHLEDGYTHLKRVQLILTMILNMAITRYGINLVGAMVTPLIG